MVVDVLGTTQADMTSNIAALERMLTIAQERQITQQGTKVVLIVQQGTTAANDVSYTVLNGGLSLDESAIRSVSIAQLRTRATLTLLVEPFGKLPVVTMGRKKIYSEQDVSLAGPNINYIDIGDGWGGFFTFDGSVSNCRPSVHSSLDNKFATGATIRVRIRFNSLAAKNGIIYKGGVWTLSLNTSGELIFHHDFSGTDGEWVTTNANLVAGIWYVITLSYNGSSVGNDPAIKVDGGSNRTLTESTTPVGTITDDNPNTIIFGWDGANPPGNYLNGDISEAAYYSSATVTDSVTQELSGTESNLISLWPFEEGTGTKIRDAVTTNHLVMTPGDGVWGVDPTRGNAGGLLQVRIEDEASTAWTAAKTLYIATRSGARRADTLFDEVPNAVTHVDADILSGSAPAGNETSAGSTTGGPTTNASGGASAYFRTTAAADNGILQTGFLIRGYFDYRFTTLPEGLFRVLARCQVIHGGSVANVTIANSGFGFALSYNFGGVTTTPVEADRVGMSAFSQWELLDLGEINIAPIATPTGFTDPTLSVRVNACLNHSGVSAFSNTDYVEWSCDSLFLLPIDEGSAIINSIDATDEVLLSLSSDPPGAWLLNTSSVTLQFADFHGSPIRLGPEATRFYWIKDDPKDPSTMIAYAYASYVPLVSGL
jgi:hypothetical protein